MCTLRIFEYLYRNIQTNPWPSQNFEAYKSMHYFIWSQKCLKIPRVCRVVFDPLWHKFHPRVLRILPSFSRTTFTRLKKAFNFVNLLLICSQFYAYFPFFAHLDSTEITSKLLAGFFKWQLLANRKVTAIGEWQMTVYWNQCSKIR